MKRVAICFWGQTRTDKGLEECYKKLKSKNVQYDFFVSTWDDFENKSIFDFCVKKDFVQPDNLKFRDNTDRASYLIHRVNSLKTQHEIQNNFIYDYVMWTRSEVLFSPDSLLKLIYEKLANHEEFEINSPNDKIGVDVDEFGYLPSDLFFLGTSAVFDLYATGWKRYYKRRHSFSIGRHGGHNYHAWVINNLPIKHIPTKLGHDFLINKLKPREVR